MRARYSPSTDDRRGRGWGELARAESYAPSGPAGVNDRTPRLERQVLIFHGEPSLDAIRRLLAACGTRQRGRDAVPRYGLPRPGWRRWPGGRGGCPGVEGSASRGVLGAEVTGA